MKFPKLKRETRKYYFEKVESEYFIDIDELFTMSIQNKINFDTIYSRYEWEALEQFNNKEFSMIKN